MDNIDKKSINKNGMAKVVQIPPRIGWKRMGKIMKNYGHYGNNEKCICLFFGK